MQISREMHAPGVRGGGCGRRFGGAAARACLTTRARCFTCSDNAPGQGNIMLQGMVQCFAPSVENCTTPSETRRGVLPATAVGRVMKSSKARVCERTCCPGPSEFCSWLLGFTGTACTFWLPAVSPLDPTRNTWLFRASCQAVFHSRCEVNPLPAR